MYDVPFNRYIRHAMPSADRKLELKEDIDGSDRLTTGCVGQRVILPLGT
jgi:hypothetical protein